MASRVLKPGGSTLIKTFQGTGFTELVAASRARSPELYLLARDYRMV